MHWPPRSTAGSCDPAQTDYDPVRVLFNTRFDGQRPGGVVQAAGSGDVAEAIRFARQFGLPVRPRAGGHSYVGDSTFAEGLVIDVRPMSRVTTDPASGEARIGAGDPDLLPPARTGQAVAAPCPWAPAPRWGSWASLSVAGSGSRVAGTA